MDKTAEKLKAQVLDRVDKMIQKNGHTVMGVFESDEQPTFSYTIGLTEKYDHPELIIMGLSLEASAAMLNTIADRVKMGEKLFEGMAIKEVASVDLTARDAEGERACDFALHAEFRYSRTNYKPRYIQIVWPDEKGNFPWDAQFNERLRSMQIQLWTTKH